MTEKYFMGLDPSMYFAYLIIVCAILLLIGWILGDRISEYLESRRLKRLGITENDNPCVLTEEEETQKNKEAFEQDEANRGIEQK